MDILKWFSDTFQKTSGKARANAKKDRKEGIGGRKKGQKDEGRKEGRKHKPPQREKGRSHGETGGRRRWGLQLQAAGADGVEKWGMTPPLASHTSDLTGRLSHTPS